jgi:hypothetical protein
MSKVFFTTELMGGLGNQMFQIAHVYAQSKRFNIDYKLKPKSNTNLQGYQPNKYLDNIYRNLKFEDFETTDLYVTSDWDFREINPIPKYSTEFRGYFQSSKNFYGFYKKIKDLFSPTTEFLEKIKSIYPQVFYPNSVIIHIRRGDYLKFPEIHPTIDVSYINYCLQKIENYDNIYVVSDDKNWVKENVKIEKLIVVDGLDDYEELWLISLFNNIIMSNSTFSWWGAFLNQLDSPKIYVPNCWFGPKGEQNINDLYEENWIKINVKYENGKLICC